jgi:predicted DNA-binding protein
MTDRTTVRLPDELLRQAKRKAAAEGRTLTSLIEEGLRRVVSEMRDTTTAKPVMPRVSTAKGWLRAGIADLREARELEDLEYVRKLRRL